METPLRGARWLRELPLQPPGAGPRAEGLSGIRRLRGRPGPVAFLRRIGRRESVCVHALREGIGPHVRQERLLLPTARRRSARRTCGHRWTADRARAVEAAADARPRSLQRVLLCG